MSVKAPYVSVHRDIGCAVDSWLWMHQLDKLNIYQHDMSSKKAQNTETASYGLTIITVMPNLRFNI